MKFAAAAVLSLALQATDFYVSPNGADTNPGTPANHFVRRNHIHHFGR